MRRLRSTFWRLTSRDRATQVEREVNDELRAHIELRIEDNVAHGMGQREARREALRRFGDLDDARNRCRTIRMASLKPRSQGGPIEAVLYDLRHGARSLALRPGLTVAAVLTLALGIGANAAMFSVIETVILAPLPFEAPDRVVQLWDEDLVYPDIVLLSRANFRDYENLNDVFSHVAAVHYQPVYRERENRFDSVEAIYFSADLFDMMGVVPTAGRTFRVEEDVEGVGHIVLLTHAYWLREFGGEEVIGQTIPMRIFVPDPDDVNGPDTYPMAEYEIVGVLPSDFRVPPLDGSVGGDYGVRGEPEMVLPLGLWTFGGLHRGWYSLYALAQLREGVTVEQARANLQGIAAGIAEIAPETSAGLEVTVVPVGELVRQEYAVALGFLWAATALLWLVACASVSSLLLGWWMARERELAVRAALGAGARRIFSQLLTEAMVLAAAAGVLGVLLAFWGIAAIKMLAPAGTHRLDEISLDTGVLGFAMGLSLVTVLLVGLWPALRGGRHRSWEALKAGGRGATLARTRSLRVLVTAEVALSLVLLAGAGLMLQSFWNLVGVDTGMATEQVVEVTIERPRGAFSKYSAPLPGGVGAFPSRGAANAAKLELFLLMKDRVEAIPGVTSFAHTLAAPLSGEEPRPADITIPGRPRSEMDELPGTDSRWVSPGFFRTLGIQLLEGRTWDLSETSRRLVVISETMAKTYWPGESAVGKQFGRREVIGVVGDVRNTLEHEPIPTYYIGLGYLGGRNLFIRTSVDPAGLAQVLRREIEAIDPHEFKVLQIRTMGQIVAEHSADSRFRAQLVVLFAALATGITCLGLFGVLTYAVAQRTRELGIRMALGAGNSQIVGLVLSQGARMVGLGVALGLVLVFWMTRYISSLLFGIAPLDPTTLVGGAGLVFALALLAAYLPARRAMRVDPIEALRHG